MKALHWYGADPLSITQVPSKVLDHIYEGHMDPSKMLEHIHIREESTPLKQASMRRHPDEPDETAETVYRGILSID